MKSILLSIKPKWVAKILNGEKTIEVRKSNLKCDLPIDVYIYCTKDKELLHKNCADIYWVEDKDFKAKSKQLGLQTQPILNGKVLFKFRCYKVEEIKTDGMNIFSIPIFYTDCVNYAMLQARSCLNLAEIDAYLKGKKGYAIHISDLEIFDKSKELNEFNRYHDKKNEHSACWTCKRFGTGCMSCKLTKAPQNYCYIETEN